MISTVSLLSGFTPILFGVGLAAVFSAASITIDYAKLNWRKRFRQQIKLAFIREAFIFQDLEHLSERWAQDRKAVLQSLRVLLADAVSGEDEELTKRVETVRKILLQHQAREPYSELPENIGLQLARIAESSSSTADAIAQLAVSLSELYSSNQRELIKQKKLSFWGFIVGVAGLLASIPGLYLTYK
jgi:hypothetical protein